MTVSVRVDEVNGDVCFDCPDCGAELERTADGETIELDDIGAGHACDD